VGVSLPFSVFSVTKARASVLLAPQGIELAILALHEASARQQQSGARTRRLVVAGGYDSRLAENREYYEELAALVRRVGLSDQV